MPCAGPSWLQRRPRSWAGARGIRPQTTARAALGPHPRHPWTSTASSRGSAVGHRRVVVLGARRVDPPALPRQPGRPDARARSAATRCWRSPGRSRPPWSCSSSPCPRSRSSSAPRRRPARDALRDRRASASSGGGSFATRRSAWSPPTSCTCPSAGRWPSTLEGSDVIHSFWVPAARRQARRGPRPRSTGSRFTADTPGSTGASARSSAAPPTPT